MLSYLKKQTGIIAIILAMLLCSVAFAKREIVVYTALEDDELSIYTKQWENTHPEIKLKIIRDSTGIITAKALAEKDNIQADVFWGISTTSLLLFQDKGMLAPYAPKDLENIKKGFKDELNATPFWVGIKAYETSLICNTMELKMLKLPIPKSYADLIKPEYKDQIIMPNPASSGTGFLTVSGILQLMGEEKGWAYLDSLHKNMLRYTHSGSAPAKLAGKGECSIGISYGYRGLKQKAAGEPLRVILPSEGSGWDLEANGLAKKKEISDDAKIFLDWAISKDAMTLYSKTFPIIAYKMDVRFEDEDYPLNPEEHLIKVDFYWASKNRDRILKEWSKRYDSKSDKK